MKHSICNPLLYTMERNINVTINENRIRTLLNSGEYRKIGYTNILYF